MTCIISMGKVRPILVPSNKSAMCGRGAIVSSNNIRKSFVPAPDLGYSAFQLQLCPARSLSSRSSMIKSPPMKSNIIILWSRTTSHPSPATHVHGSYSRHLYPLTYSCFIGATFLVSFLTFAIRRQRQPSH